MSNFFQKPFNKQSLIFLLFGAWFVFSVYYIATDQWNDFKARELQNAYQKGVADSVKTLMTQMQDCKPVPLFDSGKKMEVISVKCLQKMSDTQEKK